MQADGGNVDGGPLRAEVDMIAHALLVTADIERNRRRGGALGLDLFPDRRSDKGNRLQFLLSDPGAGRPQSQRGPALAGPEPALDLPLAPVGVVNGSAH